MSEEDKTKPSNSVEDAGQRAETDAPTELPELTEEKIAGMTKEQLADLYVNAREMQTSSTQKFQKVGELEEQLRATQREKEYADERYRQAQENTTKLYEQLGQTYQQPAKPTTQPPSFEENPVEAYKHLQGEVSGYKEKFNEVNTRFDKLKEERELERRTQKMNAYLDKVVLPKNPHLKKGDVRVWFDEHPDAPVDFDSIMKVAGTLNEGKKKEIDIEVEKRIKEKEKAADGSQIPPGTPYAGVKLPPGKTWNDLEEAEQERIINARFHEKMNQ